MPTMIAVSSGKGGVGKTNIVANLGYLLSGHGKKVLLVDTDLGLGNLDVLLGITPKYNISHVLSGEKAITDIHSGRPGKNEDTAGIFRDTGHDPSDASTNGSHQSPDAPNCVVI